MKRIYILAIALLVTVSTSAQRSKRKVKIKPKVEEVVPVEDPRITEMRANTQKIFFFDSLVTSKKDVVSSIRLNKESGKLFYYNDFFKIDGNNDRTVFLNELGNKCYYACSDNNGEIHLYTRDKLGNQWSEPIKIEGMDGMFEDINYPFVLPDGITLYFAAKGNESIGGYDIFVTRFDNSDSHVLTPENLGMPFSSESDDYLYIIDDLDGLGWFATERNRMDGNVCVYMFAQPKSRKTYNEDDISDADLKKMADIHDIQSTWTSSNEQKRYRSTYNNMLKRNDKNISNDNFSFVINDDVNYTHIDEFKSVANKNRYKELQSFKKEYEQKVRELATLRNKYHKGDYSVAQYITELEKSLVSQETEIRDMEKSIRNSENIIINKK